MRIRSTRGNVRHDKKSSGKVSQEFTGWRTADRSRSGEMPWLGESGRGELLRGMFAELCRGSGSGMAVCDTVQQDNARVLKWWRFRECTGHGMI